MKNSLIKIVGAENVFLNETLKDHLYTKLGGVADYFVTPESESEVQELVLLAKEARMPLISLGNGSNTIFSDKGVRGIILSFKKINQLQANDEEITAGSGILLADLANFALNKNLTGLEFACGIPGTVGGALYMNAGAYGGEMKDIVLSAKVIDRDGKLLTRPIDGMNLGYRQSEMANNKEIILEVTYRLNYGDRSVIKEKMDHLTKKRAASQPLEFPSCGSVFKRPKGNYAGKLIQDSDLQGVCIGGAEVSTKHAGFIVNKAAASSEDYTALIKHIQKTVFDNFSINLEREVRIYQENGDLFVD